MQDLSKIPYGELRKMASKAQMKGISTATRAQMESHIKGKCDQKISNYQWQKQKLLKNKID